MTTYRDQLAALRDEGDAFREIWRQDGMALMEIKDGQPVPWQRFTSAIRTASAPHNSWRTGAVHADHQQPCEPWLFVLRKEAKNYDVPEPYALGANGSFAVFKKVETDVVGFEDFLLSNRDKIDPELLAAKMCGRWRNGVPLALSPDSDSPADGLSPEQLNDFEYVNSDGSGDPRGLHCPVGAHIGASIRAGSRLPAKACPAGATIPIG